jgi:hypothetical protein
MNRVDKKIFLNRIDESSNLTRVLIHMIVSCKPVLRILTIFVGSGSDFSHRPDADPAL